MITTPSIRLIILMRLTTALLLTLCISSCSKPDQPEPVDQPLTIKADVLLADEGNLFVDKSGMTVTVENSDLLITATTDAEGISTLIIPADYTSFTLVYAKPLYGTFKSYYEKRGDKLYKFTQNLDTLYEQGGDQNTLYLGESLGYKSTVRVNSLQTSVLNGKLRFNVNILSPNVAGEKYIRFFYAKDQPNISFASVPKTSKNMGMPFPVKNGDNVIEVCMECLYKCADGKSGETIYITAYGDSFYSNLYTDKATNTFMFPNLNLSNHVTPVSFVLP